MNIWKIGSRWSENGDPNSSIMSIFYRNSTIFLHKSVSTSNSFVNNAKEGDLIAIADGYTIHAVGKLLTNPSPITDYKIEFVGEKEEQEYSYIAFDDKVVGARAKIVHLSTNEQIYYRSRKAFCQIGQDWIRKLVEEAYNNQDKKFNISAHSYCLSAGTNNKNSYRSIFDGKTRYIIPIFQRPYSWDEKQIEPFITDIFRCYKNDEAMFIGTMQLSEKKFISSIEESCDVIDGQQRITTLSLLLKVLNLRYPDCAELCKISYNILETRVNNGVQEKYLREVLEARAADELSAIDHAHTYKRNFALIRDLINELTSEQERNDSTPFSIDSFIKFLLHNVYMVIIETQAGISKTLKIFNTINTTGLDLNGSDLFKVKFYEYLRDIKRYDESAFNDISALYEKIERYNEDRKRHVNFSQILRCYKDYLVAKHKLSRVLYTHSTDHFFEKLFNVYLKIKDEDHMPTDKIKQIDLRLSDIDSVIDAYLEWDSTTPHTYGGMLARHMIWWTRYGRHEYLPIQLSIKCKLNQEASDIEKLEKFSEELNKYFFIKSVNYDKSVYHAHNLAYELLELIHQDENGLELAKNKLNEILKAEYQGDNPVWGIKGNIFNNAKKKNLICAIAEYLQHMQIKNKDIASLKELIFETDFDIEHIHANADDSIMVEEVLQNSIGNLSMLERRINRSISDKPFTEKKIQYKNSKFLRIQNLSKQNQWTEEDIREHKLAMENLICNYLFSNVD